MKKSLEALTDKQLITALMKNKVEGWDYVSGVLSRHDTSTGNLTQWGPMSSRHAASVVLEEADLLARASALL